MSKVVNEVIKILPPDPAPGVGGERAGHCETLAFTSCGHREQSGCSMSHTNWRMLRVPMSFSVEAPYLGLMVWFVPRETRLPCKLCRIFRLLVFSVAIEGVTL